MESAVQIDSEILAKARELSEEFGDEFLLELIQIYLDDAPKRLAELRQALAAGDVQRSTGAAHTLKSSSANIGAMRFSELMRDMEGCGRAGDLTAMTSRLSEADAQYAAVRTALESIAGLEKVESILPSKP